jgi:hypothetical protein
VFSATENVLTKHDNNLGPVPINNKRQDTLLHPAPSAH